MCIDERIAKLRKIMSERNIDMVYIPTSDYHDSEYVDGYFKCRAWLSGFTGSAGMMVVTQEEAALWSDGRYFIQAEKQTAGTCVNFYRLGDAGVITPFEYICKNIKEEGTLAFDGKVVSSFEGENFERKLAEKNAMILYSSDLVGEIWTDRPEMPNGNVFVLDEKYCGTSLKEKCAKVREVMNKRGCQTHVLTTLDDIAYLLNIRGRDIPCTPVVLSYLMMDEENVYFYVDEAKINAEVRTYLENNGVTIKAYNDIYEDVKTLTGNVLLDKERVNYAIVNNLSDDVKVVHAAAPTNMMKAVKNEVEMENLRKAHIKDGVAVTKFMYWLKNNIGKVEMSEYSADRYLFSLRQQQEGFIEESFNTISAYNSNAAMMHYSANESNAATLKAEGMLLVDSGGQYYEGTTDITRTFGLGEVCDEWKRDFTLVLRGMIQLSRAKFLEGCTGINLDILARQAIWEQGIDYKCGTGHGIGFLLGVHEGPHGIRWKQAFNRKENTPFRAGMVVTNEPGIYIEGSHGIRSENEMICKKVEANEYGQFMDFETITFAPIDLDLIDLTYLPEECRVWLNAYHKEVYNKISPFLNEEEKVWLKEYTREI